MYRFFAYGIQMPDGNIVAQIFNTRQNATDFCKQQNIAPENIVQLFNYKTVKYIPPPSEDPLFKETVIQDPNK